MSITTWKNSSEYSSSSNSVKAIMAIVIFCAIILGVRLYFINIQAVNITNILLIDNTLITSSEIRIFEMNGLHSLDKHGVKVFDAAIKCLSKYGSTKSFKTFGFKNNKEGPRSTFLCFDIENNEWYGIVTTIFKNKTATIVTVYNVSQKVYPTIENYFEYLKRDWGAIEINYIIEASKFIVKPVMEIK